jgi:tetratricopeptide (TPR) repeat protein
MPTPAPSTGSISWSCGHCSAVIAAPRDLAGRLHPCSNPGCGKPTSVPRWGVGDRFAGVWEVRAVYEGGMGWVYRAVDLGALEEGTFLEAAFKGFKDHSPSSAVRFRAEAARWIDSTPHDHVVRAFYVIEAAGRPLLQMECMRGASLREWIRRRRLSLEQSLNFAIQLCRGMAHVNGTMGLVHRDLKPSNLLIDDLTVLKVSDIGVALPIEGGGGIGQGGVAGTPAYMSPEQFRSPTLTAASDIYSAGVVLHEMFSGRRPFAATTLADSRNAREHETPGSICDLNPRAPPALGRIVQKCLAKDPSDRYATFDELGADLTTINDTLPRKKPFGRTRTVFLPADVELKRESYSFLSLGDFKRALESAKKQIERLPNECEGWNNAAVALAGLHREDEAGPHLEKAIALNPEYVEALSNYGGLLARRGRFSEALAHLGRASSLNPGYAEAWSNLGTCRALMGDDAAARSAFQKANEVDPSYAKGWLIRAEFEGRKGDPEQALVFADRAGAAGFAGSELWEVRAKVQVARKEYALALEAAEAGLVLFPSRMALLAQKSIALEQLGREGDLLAFLSAALERLPEVAELHLALGVWQARHDRFDAAESSYARATELDPQNVLAWRERGRMLAKFDRNAEAAECFERALELSPDEGAIRADLAECRGRFGEAPDATPGAAALLRGLRLALRGRHAEAIVELDQAIATGPDDCVALRNRGCSHLELKHTELGRADLARAVELDQTDGFARVMLARAYKDLGQTARARTLAREAAALEGGGALANLLLGDVARDARDYEEGIDEYRRARALLEKELADAPNQQAYKNVLALIRHRTGICLKELGEFDEALDEFLAARELNPGDPDVEEDLRDYEGRAQKKGGDK